MNHSDPLSCPDLVADSSTSAPLLTLNRRGFLVAAGLGASAAMARDYGPSAAPVRYPDPDLVVLDDRFKKYRLGNTPIQRIYHSTEMLWAEGPAWNGVGRYLLWTISPTIFSVVGWKRTATAAHSETRPAIATVTRSIFRVARSVVNTATAALSDTKRTASSPCWPTASKASR